MILASGYCYAEFFWQNYLSSWNKYISINISKTKIYKQILNISWLNKDINPLFLDIISFKVKIKEKNTDNKESIIFNKC